jgi:transmembrane sensor
LNDQFPDIDGLLIKVILHEASDTETRQVEEWLAHNERNRQYFDHFRKIWDDSKELAIHSTVSEDDAWTRFRQQVTTPSPASPPAPVIAFSQPKNFLWGRVAAACLILLIVAPVFYLLQHRQTPGLTLRSGNSIRTDTLSDGTIISLNKNSVLKAANYSEARSVELQGEAFFTVAPDKDRPFTVHFNGGTIRVLGTSFNVKTSAAATEVIVESGLVQVVKGRQAANVRPHEKIVLKEKDSLLLPQDNPDDLYNYYRTHEFVCNHTPLIRLVDKLNEAYNAQIVLASPRLEQLQLTTTFQDPSLEEILNIVAKTFSIRIEKTGDKIILK